MNYQEAQALLNEGVKVRLPEWTGYWFSDNGRTKVLTKKGDILDNPWIDKNGVVDREDWEIADGLGFDWAINALKNGKLVTRRGWNRKGMFLFMRPGDDLPLNILLGAKSIPYKVKDYYELKQHQPISSDEANIPRVNCTAYLCMKAADDTIVNGWLASQTDMLAEDWQLFRSQV